ncbi:MAG TPA: HD-GYP domain-containing protein [Planctomycetaceae bacterium]|nr:HD-GYP domain-containing protein [Planctomycetaceae bacterium]
MPEACRQVARRGRPQVIRGEGPLAVLAVPLPADGTAQQVAVAVFVTRAAGSEAEWAAAARPLGLDPRQAALWASGQTVWAAESLERMAHVVLEWLHTARQLEALRREAGALTAELAATYEEITLLHRLAENLRLSEQAEDLARVALGWLNDVVTAESLGILYLPVADQAPAQEARTTARLVSHGPCPITAAEFEQLVDFLQLSVTSPPVVLNRCEAQRPGWPWPAVRQLLVVPVAEGANLFGWIAAFNRRGGGEFGSVEASLLGSVGAILGIHSGNIELYRQQAELMGGILRALTSAIDAKDPYTCGHSDRVARIAVRLAQELGCDNKTLNTIYLSGLLHDIGKIGIDDQVLRKPGKLSDEEYEHIKSHVRIGHNILCDIKKLDDILPGVLHHHESWDGRGYPDRAAAEGIPLIARIVAVADAFDAMASDRPYRTGMPQERIDEILRDGAGSQWDPAVIDAFFRARDDIRRIILSEPAEGTLDVSPRASAPAPAGPSA